MKHLFMIVFCLSFLCIKPGYSQEAGIQGVSDSSKTITRTSSDAKISRNYGFTLCVGISRITDSDYPLKDIKDTLVTWPCMPSVQVGFYYSFHFGKHFVVSLEPGFSMIQGNAREKDDYPGIQTIDEQRKRLFFFCMPVWYGLNFGKFEVDLGVQPSYMVYGQTQTNKVYITQYYSIPRGSSEYKRLKENPFDLGINGEVSYRFIKHLSLLVRANYGLFDLKGSSGFDSKNSVWKIRQLTIGVRAPLK